MKPLIALLLSSLTFYNYAQQLQPLPIFSSELSQWNPATSGLSHGHHATLSSGAGPIIGSYKEFGIRADYGSILLDHHGVGVHYSGTFSLGSGVDQYLNRGGLNYNYQFKFNRRKTLAIGVSAGLSSVQLYRSNDWVPPTNVADPLIPLSESKQLDLLVNAGIAYKTPVFLIGFSVVNITGENPIHISPRPSSYFNIRPVYSLHASYDFRVSRTLVIEPRALVRTDGDFSTADVNLLFKYKFKLWAGISYRTESSIGGMVGYDIKRRYRVGYSYMHNFSPLSNGDHGFHQLVLGLYIP